MPDLALTLLLIVVAAGLALALILAIRSRAALHAEREAMRADGENWRGKFAQAIADLARVEAEASQLAPLRGELADMRDRAMREGEARAALEAQLAARGEAHEAQLRLLTEARDALSARFGEIGNEMLATAQRQFLERADLRFGEAGRKSEAQLKAALGPVEATLKRYDDKLGEIEKARVGSYGELKEAVAQLVRGNEVVRSETARLTNVLRSSPKHRGRWGEEQLRTILESAGLAENVDFTLQASVSDGERQLRPDCVIRLPGGRTIVVDVKCPLVAFEQAYDEEDEARRAALLKAHADAMRTYAGQLGAKGYWRQFDLSPEFVVMFIPGEHFLAAAAERAPELIETAFRNGVVIASTINMLALAKVMAGMLRQENIAAEAREIAATGKELYRRLAAMAGHVEKLGRNLTQATGAYNSFVGSLESQVLTQAKRFETLKIETGGKAIDPMPIVETAIRPLTKLTAPADGTAAGKA